MASTVVTVQTVRGQSLRIDPGKEALQVHTAVQSAGYWIADLYWVCAAAAVPIALALIALLVYAVASALDETIWPAVSIQSVFLVLGVAWWFAAWWRSRRVLNAVLYLAIGAIVIAGAMFGAWITVYAPIRHEVAWLWWVVFSLALVQLVLMVGASIAIGSLLSCRLNYDASLARYRVYLQQAHAQLTRGDLGGASDREARLATGSMALLATAAAIGKNAPAVVAADPSRTTQRAPARSKKAL